MELELPECPPAPPIVEPATPAALRGKERRVELTVMGEKPRYLTDDEIESVLSQFAWRTEYVSIDVLREESEKDFPSFIAVDPPEYCMEMGERKVKVMYLGRYGIPGAIEYVGYSAFQSIRETIKEELRKQKNSPGVIPRLGDIIRAKYFRAQGRPGDAAGAHAAEALGGPIIQMTLNSRRIQGVVRQFSYGLVALNELFRTSKVRKDPITTIAFAPVEGNLTFEDVIDFGRRVVHLSVADLVESSVDLVDSVWTEWIDVYSRMAEVANSDTFPQIPNTDWVLMLTLNRARIIGSKLVVQDIVDALQERFGSNIVIVATPLEVGIIYVFGDPGGIRREGERYEAEITDPSPIYLETAVIPGLADITLLGWKGITGFIPVISPVWRIVAENRQIGPPGNRKYRIIWSEGIIKETKVSPERVKDLCRIGGMTILDDAEEYMDILLPEDALVEEPPEIGEGPPSLRLMTPSEYLSNIDSGYEDPDTGEIVGREYDSSGRIVNMLDSSLGSYYEAELMGYDLLNLFGMDEIDYTITYSNGIHEIMDLLGIEAARNFLIMEITRTIGSSGKYIDPRSITLLVDFMMNKGKPTNVTYAGVTRQPAGPMTKSVNQKPFEFLMEAAYFGEAEKVKNAPTSIWAGQVAHLGTGYRDTELEVVEDAYFGEKVDELPPSNEDNFDTAIADLDNKTDESYRNWVAIGALEEQSRDPPELKNLGQAAVYVPRRPKGAGLGAVPPPIPIPKPTASRELARTLKSYQKVPAPIRKTEAVVDALPAEAPVYLEHRSFPIPSVPLDPRGIPEEVIRLIARFATAPSVKVEVPRREVTPEPVPIELPEYPPLPSVRLQESFIRRVY